VLEIPEVWPGENYSAAANRFRFHQCKVTFVLQLMVLRALWEMFD
jgi:hypothetical protein